MGSSGLPPSLETGLSGPAGMMSTPPGALAAPGQPLPEGMSSVSQVVYARVLIVE